MNIVALENADNILQAVTKYLALDKSEAQNSCAYLKKVLNELLIAMKEKDVMFNKSFKTIAWAGSYWDKLKVRNPDEYDIDIVMEIPEKLYDIEVFNSKNNPGFLKVKVIKKVRPAAMIDSINGKNHSEYVNEKSIKWDKFVDCDRVLLQNKFRYWFERVVYKGINTFTRASEKSWCIPVPVEKSFRTCEVSISKSGPAMTLIVKAENTFSVDLVPVIKMSSWPPAPFCKQIREKELQKWYIVPKPKRKRRSDDSWRCSFIYHERKLLHDTLILKPVLKLVKFRDRQNLSNISSYYIKTIFMWEVLNHKNNRMFLKKRQIDLFLHMLSKLREYFEKGIIPYLWNKQFNLLSEWDNVACKNVYGKINNILLKIERNINYNPSILINILLTDTEAEEFSNYRNFKYGCVSRKASKKRTLIE